MWFAFRFAFCFVGAFLFCNINPTDEYGWASGIWHGLFFVFNWIRSLFSDTLYKAEFYTTAYNIYFWIFSILGILFLILEGIVLSKKK